MKIKIRWNRVIAYVILLLILGVLFLMLKSYFLGVFLVVLGMLTVASIVLSYRVFCLCETGICVAMSHIKEGEEADIKISAKNKGHIGLFGCDIKIKINNIFSGEVSEFNAIVPLRTGLSELLLPVNIDIVGRYEISIEQMRVSDLFGLIFFIDNTNYKKILTVLPRIIPARDMQSNEINKGATETDESERRGNDSSEVSEIRAYHDGDRIRDIHWKLSARTDELMVKVRTSLSGTELVVVLSLLKEADKSNILLRYSYSVLKKLLEGEPDVRLLCYDSKKTGFDEYRIDSEEALDMAFTDILTIPLCERIGGEDEDMELYLKNTYPYLDSYVGIYMEGSEPEIEIK